MNCTRIFALIALLGLASELPAASNGSANVSSACATVEFMGKMISLNILLPADYDDINALYDMQDSLAELNLLVCQPVILTGYSRGNSRYNNGSLISTDLYHDAWYYRDGQVVFAEPGEDSTIYYPNGRVMAHHWMHGDQAIFWPNGSLATNYF